MKNYTYQKLSALVLVVCLLSTAYLSAMKIEEEDPEVAAVTQQFDLRLKLPHTPRTDVSVSSPIRRVSSQVQRTGSPKRTDLFPSPLKRGGSDLLSEKPTDPSPVKRGASLADLLHIDSPTRQPLSGRNSPHMLKRTDSFIGKPRSPVSMTTELFVSLSKNGSPRDEKGSKTPSSGEHTPRTIVAIKTINSPRPQIAEPLAQSATVATLQEEKERRSS